MTDKELKKLSRGELLELLLNQTKEVERLRGALEKANSLLQKRQKQFDEAGTLAEAMVSVNGVMDTAQAAADQYLDNIAAMEEEARKKCERMLRSAVLEARKIRKKSELQAAMTATQRKSPRMPSPEESPVCPSQPQPVPAVPQPEQYKEAQPN